MVFMSQTIQPAYTRLYLTEAAIFSISVWGLDAHQTFLQSTELFSRVAYLKHIIPEFDDGPFECLQFL